MRKLEFGFRQPTGVLDADWGWELQNLQEKIALNDKTSLEARWSYGKVLVSRRGEAKQLPHGTLDALVVRDKISRSEINHRMRFAQTFPTRKEVSNALDTYPTWRDAIRGLPKKPKAENETQPAFTFRRWRARLSTFEKLTAADRRELAALIEEASSLLATEPAKKEQTV